MDTIFNIDKDIILYFNDFIPNHSILKNFLSFITHLGDAGFIWILIAILLTIKKSTRAGGITMLISLALGSILGNGILKNIFERQRPFVELGIQPFICKPSGFSFPSGHSTASFVGATCIFFINKKWGIGAYFLAFIIAISRVVLLVHYPTDVISGSILGIIIATVISTLSKKIKQYFNK